MDRDWTTPAGSAEPASSAGQAKAGPAAPSGAPGARLEALGDDWAAGVGAVELSPRRGRMRWGVAIGIVACVAIVTTLGAFILSGAAGTKSLTVGFVPKQTVFFMTVRTDLPGDQHDKLVEFTAHFPGFKDRAQFDTAFDEVLNRLTSSVSQDLSYTWAFKPWMAGEISIAVTRIAYPDTVDAVAIVSVKDRAKAEDWIKSVLASESYVGASYGGTTVYAKGSGATASAYAVTDKALLFGTPSAVRASLDAGTNGSLEGEANYKAAMKSFSGDRVASFYMATGPLMSELYGSLGQSAGLSRDDIAFMLSSMPPWLAGSVRVESDRVVVDMASPKMGTTASLGNHSSRLAGQVPASTIGIVEVHSVGQLVNRAIAMYEAPLAPAGYRSIATSVRDALKTVGGIEWLGDAAVVVTENGTTFSGGLVAETKDSQTAGLKVDTLTNLLTLSSSSFGIVTHEETYKGVRITVAHMDANSTSGTPALDIAFASKDNLIIAGWDAAFVKAMIDTTPANSLAAQGDYKSAMAAAGESNEMSVFVNVGAIAAQMGPSMYPSDPTYYDLYLKPYLSHLGGVAVAQIDAQPIVTKIVVMAK